jgi:Protein of unknown function (DUF4012)
MRHSGVMRSVPARLRPWLVGALGLLVLGAVAGGWLMLRAGQARDTVVLLRADGAKLQEQVKAGDLTGISITLTRLRTHADQARSQTGDPVWALASHAPLIGRDLRAVREVSAAVAGIADAAQPLETALPRLAPGGKPFAGGRIDVTAVAEISRAIPAVSAAVASGEASMQNLRVRGLRPEVAVGVSTLQRLLATVKGPIADSVPTMQLLPQLLGADRPRTYMVLLQQGAEARGTGGLVGAYAVLRTDKGRLSLLKAAPRGELQQGSGIPTLGLPQDLQELWGTDLSEWAGLNLSPNFPWTGRLVAAGWKANGLAPSLDYVAGLDQGVVAAMLAATGPVTVRGLTIDSSNVVEFLTRDVYARYRDPQDVDRVTAELVQVVFGRFADGRVDLGALVKSMAPPVHERRLQLWAADQEEQRLLETLTVAGAIPDTPGPFAMAVVNNGGGNKLDAYLKVHTAYQPGTCAQQVRVGHITVQLDNTAPTSGLPDYVDVRSDVLEVGLSALGLDRTPKRGSNRVLLDVYGPVGGQAALITVDGNATPTVQGSDRGHPVWRVAVPINPGQQRVIDVVVTQPVGIGPEPAVATVLLQPMVNPATASIGGLTPCQNKPADQG